MKSSAIKWAVFASGSGTNLQNFIDLQKNGELKTNSLRWVYCSRACPAVDRARDAGIAVSILDPKSPSHDHELLTALEEFQIDRIFLLGYMKILSTQFLEAWSRPIVNLHPSLLPSFKGAKAIERSYEAGEKSVGVSLHQVTESLDSGPILAQKKWERPQSLRFEAFKEKIHELEREIVREYLFDLELESSASLS